jgi:subtilisin family serine protease
MLAAATLALLLAAPGASAVVYSPDRVIVQWAAGTAPAERQDARAEAGVDFAADLGSRRFQLVEAEPGQSSSAAIRELRADPAVVLAERDGYAPADAVPDDPLFGQLWGLRNTGQGVWGVGGAVAGADIDALGAWGRTLGTPETVVAVLDSGYRFEHPDLAGTAWTNPGEIPGNGEDDDDNGIADDVRGADFVGSDAEAPAVDGDPTDDNLISGGHGTHTAGTIAAVGDNGVGVVGVAQGATIMPLRVCSDLDHTLECVFSSAIAAINYAGEHGARVANLSFGSPTFSVAIGSAIAANPETLFVVSAGNEQKNNDLAARRPCTVELDNVICVAATDQADQLASFSNWGAKSVDLGAPGTETLSTDTRNSLVEDDFEVDDFAQKWSADGPDGGFVRSDQAPLASFGISAWGGAVPVADSVRASVSAAEALPPGIETCILEFDRATTLVGGRIRYEVRLDGETAVAIEIGGNTDGMRREGVVLGDAFVAGGDVDLRFEYVAGPDPQAGEGAWIDNVKLHCPARVGEADGYAFRQGTSMAAPHVAGAAALAFSLKPDATVAEVRQGLLGSVDPVPALAGRTVSGGRLDASAALDLFDAVAPPVPGLSATNPSSPSGNDQPRVIGSAQRGASVEVFANGSCSGAPVAGGSAAGLAGAGIPVEVAEGATTELTVRATDLVPLVSSCSAPIAYTHQKPPPDPDEDYGGGDPAPTPERPLPPSTPAPPAGDPAPPRAACVVPKLAGLTLAKAKQKLRKAACRVGTVRKLRAARGKPRPPLVVKRSNPGAGARPASGKVGLTLAPRPRKAPR